MGQARFCEGMVPIVQSEHCEMAEVDFFTGLLQMAGRHVRVRYSRDGHDPDLIGATAEMKCWDREYHDAYTIEARIRPDGAITIHGGNRIENASTLHEAIDLFASSAPYAQGA